MKVKRHYLQEYKMSFLLCHSFQVTSFSEKKNMKKIQDIKKNPIKTIELRHAGINIK